MHRSVSPCLALLQTEITDLNSLPFRNDFKSEISTSSYTWGLKKVTLSVWEPPRIGSYRKNPPSPIREQTFFGTWWACKWDLDVPQKNRCISRPCKIPVIIIGTMKSPQNLLKKGQEISGLFFLFDDLKILISLSFFSFFYLQWQQNTSGLSNSNLLFSSLFL